MDKGHIARLWSRYIILYLRPTAQRALQHPKHSYMVPQSKILKLANWSNEETFTIYYHRSVASDTQSAEMILT